MDDNVGEEMDLLYGLIVRVKLIYRITKNLLFYTLEIPVSRVKQVPLDMQSKESDPMLAA